MTNKIVYTDGEIGEVRIIADFLPPPSMLAFREDTVKVTIALSKSSVEFFKEEAAKQHTWLPVEAGYGSCRLRPGNGLPRSKAPHGRA